MKKLIVLALVFGGLVYASKSMRKAQERVMTENRQKLLDRERAMHPPIRFAAPAAAPAPLQQPVELAGVPDIPQLATPEYPIAGEVRTSPEQERRREEQQRRSERFQKQMRYGFACTRARENLHVLKSVAHAGGAWVATKRVSDPDGGPEKRVVMSATERAENKLELERFIAENCDFSP